MKGKSQKPILAALILLAFTATAPAQDGKIGIIAHRGFWQAESAQGAQNSLASVGASIENGFWGSELDTGLTSDNVILVNHDNDIGGVKIRKHPFSTFAEMKLCNGEAVPTLGEYLKVAKKGKKTKIVLEIKDQGEFDSNILLTELAIKELKSQKLYKPSRVMFISFSLDVCKHLAQVAPEFTNQYLSGDKTPAELKALGINGIDYNFKKIRRNPEWVAQAHALGMSVNVWTVNEADDMSEMIGLGVDCITTDKPLLLRRLLGDRELIQ